MKKVFLIFIIIFSLIGFVGCTQKDDTKSQFIKDFDIDIEEKDIELKEEFNDYGGFPYEGMALYRMRMLLKNLRSGRVCRFRKRLGIF